MEKGLMFPIPVKMLAQNFPKSQFDCVELDGNMVETTQFMKGVGELEILKDTLR